MRQWRQHRTRTFGGFIIDGGQARFRHRRKYFIMLSSVAIIVRAEIMHVVFQPAEIAYREHRTGRVASRHYLTGMKSLLASPNTMSSRIL